MPTIGLLGTLPESDFAANIVEALSEPDVRFVTLTDDLGGEPQGTPMEVLNEIADASTDLIVVLFSAKYVEQLKTDKRLEAETLFRVLQQHPAKVLPLFSEPDLKLPPVFASLQLYDVQKLGLTALVHNVQLRLDALRIKTTRLSPHPRFSAVMNEAFARKTVSSVSGEVVIKDQEIGYELFKVNDPDFGDLFVVHTYEPIVIRKVAEHFKQNFSGLFKGRLYLVANRDRAAPNPEVRLENLRAALNAEQAWYVDAFIAERLGWNSNESLRDIPLPKEYFVEPSVSFPSSPDKKMKALHALHEWRIEGSAILVVRGGGGIGKTQLLRKFARDVATQHDVSVAYLDSVSVLDYLRSPHLNVSFGLEALGELIGDKVGSRAISSNRLETLLTSNRVLVILDGLDEIIPRLPTDYSVADFFATVQGVVENVVGGRLLISCRNAFWEADRTPLPIPILDVEAFDSDQVTKYLDNRFKDEPRARQKCDKMLQEMRGYFSSDIYPFMLDLACRMTSAAEGKIADKADAERAYFDDGQLLDEVIWHVCRREAAKFGQEGLRLEEHPLDVPLQCKFLVELALSMNQMPGVVLSEDALKHLERSQGKTVTAPVFAAFRSHPLLDTEGDRLRFSYDFVQEFFLAVGLKQALRLERNISDAQAYYLTSLSRVESNFLRTVARKVGALSDENVLGIAEFIRIFRNQRPTTKDREVWHKAVGGAVNIGLQCLALSQKWDQAKASSYLVELFGVGDGQTLSDLVLLAPNSEKRMTFTFEGRRLENSAIIDYDDFLRCKFDLRTKFINSVLHGGKFPAGIKTSLTSANLDDSCAVDERIMAVVRSRDNAGAADEAAVERAVRTFLRGFRSHGTFHRPRDITTIAKSVGLISFKRFLDAAITEGLVVDGVGRGSGYIGIAPPRIPEVEDFVDQGVQGPVVRRVIQALVS